MEYRIEAHSSDSFVVATWIFTCMNHIRLLEHPSTQHTHSYKQETHTKKEEKRKKEKPSGSNFWNRYETRTVAAPQVPRVLKLILIHSQWNKSTEQLNKALDSTAHKESSEESITAAITAPFAPMATAPPTEPTGISMSSSLLPMEKLQGSEDWAVWLQNLTINTRFSGLWDIISGKEKKPKVACRYDYGDLEKRIREWEQKDIRAMGHIMSFLSLEIRAKLAREGFKPDTMTSNDLLTMTEQIVLNEPQEENLKAIERFNSLVDLSYRSRGEFIRKLLQYWDRVKMKSPGLSDRWFTLIMFYGFEPHNEDESEV